MNIFFHLLSSLASSSRYFGYNALTSAETQISQSFFNLLLLYTMNVVVCYNNIVFFIIFRFITQSKNNS